MPLRRFTLSSLVALLAGALFSAPSSSAPPSSSAAPSRTARRPTSADIERIREELRARQSERDALSERQSIIPWRQLAVSPDQRAGDRCILVRLSNATNVFRAAWTFTPAEGNGAAPVRTLLCWRGEQWIALAPGKWRAEAALGRANGARAFRFPIAELQGRRGEVYELTLDGPVEQAALAMEREALKKLDAIASRMREPDQNKQAGDAAE